MSICNNCKKEFTTKYTLIRHQESNVCTTIKQKKIVIHECNRCLKKLSTKQCLKYHLDRCKQEINSNTKYKELEEKLEEKISEMSKEIETLKQKTTITINNDYSKTQTQTNNYGSILSLTKDTFKKNYTIKDLAGSQKSLADFTNKNILNNNDTNNPLYMCKDKTRQKFVFTDEDHNEREDVNASILIKIVSKGFHHIKKVYKKETEALQKRIELFEKSDNHINLVDTREKLKILNNKYNDVINLVENGDGYRLHLSKILPSSIEDRIIIEKKLKELESTDSDSDSEDDSDDDEKSVQKLFDKNQPYTLHDKTARNIGGITYGGLLSYKNHYKRTGEIIAPGRFRDNDELLKQFTEFLKNDE